MNSITGRLITKTKRLATSEACQASSVDNEGQQHVCNWIKAPPQGKFP